MLNKLKIESEIIENSKSENISLIYSNTQIIDFEKKPLNIYGSGIQGLTRGPFLKSLSGFHAHTSNLVVNSNILKSNEVFFNESMSFAEDTLFTHEILLCGNIYYIDTISSYPILYIQL